MEVTTIFIFSNILYMGTSILFAEGEPFRKPFYTNIIYMVNLLIVFVYNWLLAGVPEARFPELEYYGDSFDEDQENTFPNSWLIEVNGWGILTVFIMILVNQFIVKRYFESQQKK